MQLTRSLVVIAICLWSTVIRAQPAPSPGAFATIPFEDTHRVLFGDGIQAALQRTTGSAGSLVTTGDARVAAALAAAMPAASRAEAERVFSQLLAGFGKLEGQLGLSHGDLAGATALFVVACVEAAQNIRVDPANYRAIVDDLRRALTSSSTLAGASAAAKRMAYERLVIVGMFVAGMRAQTDANLSQSLATQARSYLQRLLQIDPDRIRLDASGIAVTGAAQVAAPAPAPTAPPKTGLGIAVRDLVGVLSSWEQVYQYDGLQLVETTYLLLRDGTCTTDATASLEALDAAASKVKSPGKWGRWRKTSATYEISLNGRAFKVPPNPRLEEPARPNERLDGTYKWSGGGTVGADGAYWMFKTITFRNDGTFESANWGGSGGGTGDTSPGSTTAYGVYDDEGSAGAVVGSNIAGGRTRKTGRTKADRSGTYQLDGYTLELRFASGKVERSFFSVRDDRKVIMARGYTMMKQKPEKSKR